MLNEEGLKAAAKAIHGSNFMQPVAGPWLEDGSVSEKFATQAAEAAITAYLSTVEKPVAVKQLEWKDGRISSNWERFIADTIFGTYEALEWSDGRFGGSVPGAEESLEFVSATLETAKACAQADFEKRVLSALVIPTPPTSATKGE